MNVFRLAGFSQLALLVVLLLAAPGRTLSKDSQAPSFSLQILEEGELPAGMTFFRRAERSRLQSNNAVVPGLERFQQVIREHTPELQAVDWAKHSRLHAETTIGWKPETSMELKEGRAVGADASGSILYLEFQGPRLPAEYEIVHRHLFFYGAYDVESDQLLQLFVVIRGWVLE